MNASRLSSSSARPMVLIASGASGGHLFPAIAVAQALRSAGAKGADVILVLGGKKFSDLVEKEGIPLVRLPAAAFNDRGPIGLLWAAFKLMRGFWQAFVLVRRTRPVVVFGTGGYASVALILAAKLLGVRTLIHEQNVLPGRANRVLSKVADGLILTFPESRRYFPGLEDRITVAGTPLRAEILVAAQSVTRTVPSEKNAPFTLLVLGGSQGARILSEVLPETLALMPAAERKTLCVVHQARPEDVAAVTASYAQLGLREVTVQPFFSDMPARYAAADMLIGRSGVGTVLEAAAFGLPAIYVPLELADGHQKLNADVAESAGAAVVVEQAYFTPANVLVHVRSLRLDIARREAMVRATQTLFQKDATQNVVRVILKPAKPNT